MVSDTAIERVEVLHEGQSTGWVLYKRKSSTTFLQELFYWEEPV